MNISPVQLEREEINQLFPAQDCGLMEISNSIIFAASDEDGIRSAVSVSELANIDTGYCINHITKDAEKDVDTLRLIISRIEKECILNEYSKVAVHLPVDNASVMMKRLLFSMGYVDNSNGGIYMCYKVGDIMNTVFGSKRDYLKGLMKSVKIYSELTDEQITVFSNKYKFANPNNDLFSLDVVFGKFFLLEGEVVGYMNIKEVQPGYLLLTDVYIEENVKTKYALPAMIASVMYAFEALMPDEAFFGLQIYNKHLLNGVMAAFGNPLKQWDILEMSKWI